MQSSVKTTNCLQLPTQTRHFIRLVSMLCLLGLPRAGLADTYVSGTVAGETWTQANSPYRVVGNIQVALLTISPGVTVFFESNYVFEVGGFLTATGSASQPIIFTRTNGGGWQGIFLNNCLDGSELAHCQISGSVNSGIRCVNADAIVRSCVLSNNSSGPSASGGGISVNNQSYAGSTIVITNCTFDGNTAPGNGGAVAMWPGGGSGGIHINDCTFDGNTAGGPGGAVVMYLGAMSGGISIGDCVFSSNHSPNEGGALHLNSQSYPIGDTLITNCTFTGNSGRGAGGAVSARLGNNMVSRR